MRSTGGMAEEALSHNRTMSFEERLDRLAQVAVHVGLGLKPGQQVVLTAPLEAVPLVRRISEHAYRAGANLVTTLLADEESTLLRYRYAPDSAFDAAANWLFDGMARAYAEGSARLAIAGGNPALLAGQDPTKVGRANAAVSKAMRPALDLITKHEINWTIVSYATPAWARAVFPDEPEERAIEKLWEAIFAASRVDASDPVEAWKQHDAHLQQRAAKLNDKRYSALRFHGPGTDLTVGLADDHLWLGGGTDARNGVRCIPNIPTEEVFTTPHRDRVEGEVTSTKPLSHQGTLIKDIHVRFEKGRVVQASASEGEQVLLRMLDTDSGARHLGEVALVPHSSPIAQSGLLFWNTLFDENAASHIALGQAYSTCMREAESLSGEQLRARGANESLIHVDWMIGSGKMNVDGIDRNGKPEPLMRAGEWV